MTNNERRDYLFYLQYPRDGCFMLDSNECVYDPHGPPARDMYIQIDKMGSKPPYLCNDPIELSTVLQGKRLVNFDIKQWLEGLYEGTLSIIELHEHVSNYPQWVWKSILGGIKQRAKLLDKKRGH